ncbi:hypothetical protein GCM10020358_83200 [Amorphoplanes nipponensis]|uniref:Prenyltransferase and squalene oxidase repeat-containing protein n=1 Tax=Actinoplanes nipponensis TaxID=135950 RepID=A0A919JDM7_9ACTN|nr:hypothetical protein [Actinoplanes nipponensis]GIE47858.1 hypothetical protein Ani05nite_13920 [Actinoplanes nipponensis]
MDDVFAAAERFLRAEARLLEQRLFDTLFHGAPAGGVVDALRGYQNEDGGFGHGLEPDKCCPASLPLDVEIALRHLVAAGASDPRMVRRAADFLGAVAVDGAVPLTTPVIEAYPRAEHMTDWTYVPGLNPTAGLAALLYQLDVAHPWRDAATGYCWRALEDGPPPEDVHAVLEVLAFLAHVPDRERADRHAAAVAERLRTAKMFHLDPHAEGYGLTPLHFAPAADSRWRPLFTDAQLDGHLDHLLADQQPDGGWPLTWEPPSAAARLAWRGMVTLEALRTLDSYGRLRR